MSAGFTELYGAHFHRLTLQLSAYLGDRAEAQDVTQEAFCRAFDRWDRVGSYADPAAWVRHVAWNLATSKLRRYRVARQHAATLRTEHAAGPSPDRVALVTALAQLPPKHREAVVRHYLGQSTIAEIAAEKGVPEGTVRSWLSRGRSDLAEYFREYEKDTVLAIQPDGVDAAVAQAGQRRSRRPTAVAVAIVAALAVLLPLSWLVLRGDAHPPMVDPTPSPSQSPSPLSNWDNTSRVVRLPGVGFDRDREMRLMDATHAWAYVDECQDAQSSQGRCRSALGYSEDAGRTWHRVTMPDNTGQTEFRMAHERRGSRWLPLDANTLSLVTKDRIYLTKDRGTTWKTFPLSDPPIQTLRAANVVGTLSDDAGEYLGEYQFQCVGRSFLADQRCSRSEATELVRLGLGLVKPQPTWRTPLNLRGVQQGGDGRIWAMDWVNAVELQAVVVSSDQGKTWREFPLPLPVKSFIGFDLSPDGSQAVISDTDRSWRLDGDRWVEFKGIGARDLSDAIVLNDGTVVGVFSGRGVYVVDGEPLEIPDLPGVNGVSQLPDGTIVFGSLPIGKSQYVGVGTGMARRWSTISVMS